jgi:uncharacterized repeat protein (TIGR03843 family)
VSDSSQLDPPSASPESAPPEPASVAVTLQQVLDTLRLGEIRLVGRLPYGSNDTFLATVHHQHLALPAVYKPTQGEQPLWDFSAGTLAGREVAAFLLSEALGWGLVPPTALREGEFGVGSLQFFIECDPERHYFNFTDSERQQLPWAAVFDVLANNADRKGGHLLLDGQGQMWLIDHGLCFHELPKLRTVIWDFAGQTLPAPFLQDIRRVAETFAQTGGLAEQLAGYLSESECAALLARLQNLLAVPQLPFPKGNRSYPWPPV